MAEHFNGRVQYYEIWNEPTENPGGDPRAPIALSDYLEVVSQVAPIIQDINPTAKIVVGALGRLQVRSEVIKRRGGGGWFWQFCRCGLLDCT